MNTHADKTQENKNQLAAIADSQKQSGSESTFQFVDNQPEAITQRKLQEMANNSSQVKQLRVFQEMANNSRQAKHAAQLQAMGNNKTVQNQQSIRKKENNTGLPDNLKSGIENLSGYSLDDVKVYRNSDKPAQLQAHAYVQGTDIHLGSRQEKHLPHEAWHVVQQKQGRVKPTMQMMGGVNVNDDNGLEKEADIMGTRALQVVDNQSETIAQRKLQEMANSPLAKKAAQLQLPLQLQKNSSFSSPTQGTIQRMIGANFAGIMTQANLIAALQLLNPPVREMIPAQYAARGATPQMLDAAIAGSNLNLYDGMSRGELLRELRPLLDNHVTNDPANYAYDAHGDKHFPGGPPGTKFNGAKAAVNPQLVALIAAQIGRIRRDSGGNNQTYYYTLAGIPQCGGLDLTIQVDYTYVGDVITYHGYPDNGVLAYSLSRAKNGAPIP